MYDMKFGYDISIALVESKWNIKKYIYYLGTKTFSENACPLFFAMSAKFSLRDNSIAKHVPKTMLVTFKNVYNIYLYIL